jgi:hypothetical protein
VDNGNVRNGDALGHGEEDGATSLDSDVGSVCGSARACGEVKKTAQVRFEGRGMPAQCTARHKIPFRMSRLLVPSWFS